MIKEMSNFDDYFNMNLHEECLLKYLINPLELYNNMEVLKKNNLLLENVVNNKKIDNETCEMNNCIKYIHS